MLSVLNVSDQITESDIVMGVVEAWRRLGASPLLIDASGTAAKHLLGCHPLHEWNPLSGKAVKDCVLVHNTRAVVVAKNCHAGYAEVIHAATSMGYRDLVFGVGDLKGEDARIDVRTEQDILVLASCKEVETVYALLKGLDQSASPATIWLLWDGDSAEAECLLNACDKHLNRKPEFIKLTRLSRSGHAFERNSLSISLQDNDFLEIVSRIASKRSVRGEETPTRTKRHA